MARPRWEGGRAADQAADQVTDRATDQALAQSATTPTGSAAAQPGPAEAASDPSAADPDAVSVAVDGAQQQSDRPQQAAPSADRQEGATGAAAAADDPGSRSGQRLPVTGFSNLGAAALGVAAVLLASGLAIIVRMRRRSG